MPRSVTGRRVGDFRLILRVGVLAAVLASVICAFMFALLNAMGPTVDSLAPSVWDIVKTTWLLLPITLVSCGSFGFLAGIAGAAFLVWRKPRIRSTRRLMIESAIAGLALGLGFPFFDGLLNQHASGWGLILSAPTGLFCAIICAASFDNQLMTK